MNMKSPLGAVALALDLFELPHAPIGASDALLTWLPAAGELRPLFITVRGAQITFVVPVIDDGISLGYIQAQGPVRGAVLPNVLQPLMLAMASTVEKMIAKGNGAEETCCEGLPPEEQAQFTLESD